ncbi:hypothetical protein L1887_34802 [Cichorium endivia]|nr:hypothetical protein L1887_34802 [Cichorium endivia]
MDVDSASGPVYDFSQLSRTHHRNEKPAEREKLEAEFKQKIKSIVSEIDITATNLKALDQSGNYSGRECFESIVISLKDTFYDKAEALVGVYKDSERGCSMTLTFDLTKYREA